MLDQPLPIIWQKRFFDLIISTILLVITAPIFLFFIILIFLEHLIRGFPIDPLFYKEERISRNKLFLMYKFNIFDQRIIDSMKKENKFIHTKELEYKGNTIYIGKILKQIYLDELPQLLNVFMGEMSLVGPRPLNKEVYATVNMIRLHPLAYIMGGMTGNFQSVKDISKCSAIKMDMEYLEKYTQSSGWDLIFFDIKIILRTIKVLLRAKGV
jgi:lipopolysaccharide/colanic/teichoic acid biosynthesis glycosyltransferase